MKNQFHINLEKYTLHQFLRSLQKRDMIPSRVILKEKIDERFEILALNQIDNLKILVDTLKTKGDIEAFSETTCIPVEYLTILKREARSYISKPIRLSKIPGVDSKSIKILDDLGIRNTKQLFTKVIINDDLQTLSDQSGLSITELVELTSLSDLSRLYGVGPVFARIIYDLGIQSVKAFIDCKANDIIAMYENETKRKADFGANELVFSIELAKELENA